MKSCTTNTCAECGREFKKRGGMHLHISKTHSMSQEDYYHKHFPRFDIRTNKIIPFKSYDQYSHALFTDKKSEYSYLLACGYSGKAKEILDGYMASFIDKSGGRFPTHCEWITYPNLGYHRIPSFKKFHDEWNKNGLKYFDAPEPLASKGRIIVDTREQKPLFEGEKRGVNVGDYILEPQYYTGVHVDRKSLDDFIGTFNGKQVDRFRREAQKARALGVKLVVVTEASMSDCYRTQPKRFTKQKTSGKTAFYSVRQLSREFSDTLQFLFVKDREEAKTYVRRVLSNPEIVKSYDLQYLYTIGKF